MFSVDKVIKCGCGNACSDYCIIKCCVHCCVAKLCPKHTKEKSDNNLCNICGNHNEILNNYLFLKDKTLVRYCSDCYDRHTDLLNYLILTFTEEEQYDKFIIKYKDSDKAVQRYNEEVEIYNKMILEKEEAEREKEKQLRRCKKMQQFLEQYKNRVITEAILNNEIKTHKYYKYCDLNEYYYVDFRYKCPECNDITFFHDTNECKDCDKKLCLACNKMKTIYCSPNCNYCRTDCCRDTDYESYCKDCYIDDNLEFYNKYKDTIITSEILQPDIDKLDMTLLEEYNLKYKCSSCLIVKDLKTNIIRCCDECNEYVCYDCSSTLDYGCLTYNCRLCNEGICNNTSSEIVCNNCYNENYSDDSSDDSIKQIIRCTSPSIPVVEGEAECNICYINVKKYACVPCGHMCMCGECSNKILDKCPICKDKIKDIIKIYL